MKKSLSKRLVFGTPTGWAGLYGFFLLTFFILWVPSTGYSSIVLPKHRLWVGATGLFLLGLVPLVLLQRRAGRLDFSRWSVQDRLPLCLAAGLLVLFCLSAAASSYPSVVWLGNRRHEGFLTLFLYLAVFSSMALWGKLRPAHAIGAALSAFLICALVLVQFFGYNPLGLYPEGLGFHDRGLRAPSATRICSPRA